MSHVLIVGGSSGIGKQIQPHLWREKHTVTPLPRQVEPPMGVAVDGLVLCQRYRGDARDDWQGEFRASMTRAKGCIEGVVEDMEDGGGSIVVMASVAGVSVEEEQPVSYHAAKAALIEMVKYYAVTLGPKQIRVNAIIPGLTIKPEARAFYDANPELEATYTDITPLGRMGTVEDIANLVDFLISPKSSYLTGQAITLDGGIGLRSHWALARRVTPALRTLPVTQRAVLPRTGAKLGYEKHGG
jgi:NAD(P)-dependent dehydrogenase (short-subunit alcohol dehydrogenase family)